MNRFFSTLVIILAMSLIVIGCTKERASSPWGDEGDVLTTAACLGCHGEEDVLKELLPPTGKVAVIDNRSDG